MFLLCLVAQGDTLTDVEFINRTYGRDIKAMAFDYDCYTAGLDSAKTAIGLEKADWLYSFSPWDLYGKVEKWSAHLDTISNYCTTNYASDSVLIALHDSLYVAAKYELEKLNQIGHALEKEWKKVVRKKYWEDVKEGKMRLGMNKEEVVCSWGMPEDINRTVGIGGVHEQWVYGDFGPYLYFDDGVLTSWQD
jgi:hypothetical protein